MSPTHSLGYGYLYLKSKSGEGSNSVHVIIKGDDNSRERTWWQSWHRFLICSVLGKGGMSPPVLKWKQSQSPVGMGWEAGGRWCLRGPVRLWSRHCSFFSSFYSAGPFFFLWIEWGSLHGQSLRAWRYANIHWFQICSECLFCAGPFGNRSPQIPPPALYSPSDLQRQDVWLPWAGWSCNIQELSWFSLGKGDGIAPFIHSLL